MRETLPENGKNNAGNGAGDDADLDARRNALSQALGKRKRETAKEAAGSGNPNSGWGEAVKVSSEFIAGVIVGAVLGFGFDRFFDTAPWGLIVFLMLGFAAGVLNVLRAVGKVADRPKL